MHCAASEGHDATMERLRAAGADINAVGNDRRGLGAGRIDPDSTQICWNFASEHQHFRGLYKHLFKLIELVVGCGGKRKVNKYISKHNKILYKSYLLKYQGTGTCFCESWSEMH